MFVKVLKGKLHRARVTGTKLHYPGSIEIDKSLMQAAGILPYECVLIANLNNGNRFETYVVPGRANSGHVVILGAAAQLAGAGDVIIIMSFAYCTPDEAAGITPKVVALDENNKIVKQH